MKRFCIIISLLAVFMACNKEEYSEVPYAPVYYSLYAEDMRLLITSLSSISITKPRNQSDKIGYGGLLIVHGIDFNATQTYYAFDLCCPKEAKSNVRIVPDETGLTATCPTCGAQFDIANGNGTTGYGTPLNGVTQYRLTPYRVVFLGNSMYRVIN